MNQLKKQVADLPPILVDNLPYLSYQAVTDTVAAFLFPNQPSDQMEAAAYQRILETADTLCRELGYLNIEKLTPPDVAFSDMGLYFGSVSADCQVEEVDIIMAGPSRVEELQDGFVKPS